MTLNISVRELSKILDIPVLSEEDLSENLRISQVATDSRSLGARDVFVALRGENFDGHEFAQTAIERGAIALIVDHGVEINSDLKVPQLVVSDTLVAYQKIAEWWRNQFSIPIIGITGSVGKTTTKELIAAALSLHGKVHKTQANYNNEIGVPKTLLEITSDHDYAIIEMAMRGRGEIALLAQIAQPTIGLITNVGTAHIGRLGSEQAIAEAKCELLAEMPNSSIAILNQDNERLMKTASQFWSGQTVTYGLEGGDIHGKLIDSQTLQVENSIFPLPLPGRHNALNYLAVLAIAKVLGLDWEILTPGLTVELPGGRARRHDLGHDILLLDETYNAGLESMLAALDLLQETPGKRRIAVLGAMKELGERSPEFHQRVGEKVKNLGLDYLFVLTNDPDAEYLVKGAEGIETECLATHEALIERLKNFMTSGDRLLFKASNSVGLGKVVAGLNQNTGK
ncbi:MAG: UDP-N-acetylmuramoyl-tripeptide--D-alanyl-D-alanine ligase [Snowella sp.]|nr:MAG: UDP-N-acetylmuramoyl-tripeptide--D-alanyl-D-alanine ligase [Snowella sp.]